MGGSVGAHLRSTCCAQSEWSEMGNEVSVFDKSMEEKLACICYEEYAEHMVRPEVGAMDLYSTDDPNHRVPYVIKDEVFPEDGRWSSGSHGPKLERPRLMAQRAPEQGMQISGFPKAPAMAISRSTFSPAPGMQTNGALERPLERRNEPAVDSSQPSPKEQERRKAQLQVVVKSFVMRAVGGVVCQVLDIKADVLRPAMYCIESTLQKLVVQVEGYLFWSTELTALVKVQTGMEGAGTEADCRMQAPALAALDRESREKLVILDVRGNDRFYILEQSTRRAEDFRITLGILSMYGRDTRVPTQAGNIRPQAQGAQNSDVRPVAGDDDGAESPAETRQIPQAPNWSRAAPSASSISRGEGIELDAAGERDLDPSRNSRLKAQQLLGPLYVQASRRLARGSVTEGSPPLSPHLRQNEAPSAAVEEEVQPSPSDPIVRSDVSAATGDESRSGRPENESAATADTSRSGRREAPTIQES